MNFICSGTVFANLAWYRRIGDFMKKVPLAPCMH